LNCVSLHGTVAFVGWGSHAEIEPARQVITKDVTIRGSCYFNIADFEEMIRFVRTKKIPLASLVTHRYPLQDASEAFSVFDAKKTLKAVLLP
jgi:threonine dehydrogenase-like Zn-dependent dehydrogenase